MQLAVHYHITIVLSNDIQYHIWWLLLEMFVSCSIELFCDNVQFEGAVATSWYSYEVSGFTYLIRLNAQFIGPLTTVHGSSGSAHLRDSAANGGPSAIYRWQGAAVFVQVRVSIMNCSLLIILNCDLSNTLNLSVDEQLFFKFILFFTLASHSVQ